MTTEDDGVRASFSTRTFVVTGGAARGWDLRFEDSAIRANWSKLKIRAKLRALLAVAAMAAGWLLVPGCTAEPPDVPSPPSRVSLLATGDTGKRNALPFGLAGSLRVGRALQKEHRAHPVDALVLLGDNFYPHGLRRSELATRIRVDLVEPYCDFVDLSAPRSAEVAGSCQLPPAERDPVPVYAVLGNHDVGFPESAELESDAIPQFVANWHLPGGVAESIELGGGVSLVLLNYTELLRSGDPAPLRDALRGARGPWRILALHPPLATLHPEPEERLPGDERLASIVGQAIEETRAAVQLVLSGHEHNLQVLEMALPLPPLAVVVGSGARSDPVKSGSPRRRFGLDRLGFARVDLLAEEPPRLRVSVYALPHPFPNPRGRPRLVARWSVDLEGRVRDELVGDG